jgi:predicted dienelactone hydrolase
MAVPTVGGNVEGKFPVVQFQHGFLIMNTCYSQIISHIASYGFIVVAPQVNKFLGIFWPAKKSSSKIMFHFLS